MNINTSLAAAATLAAIGTSQAGAATFEYRAVANYPTSAPRSCSDAGSSLLSGVPATATCASSNGNVIATASSGPDGLRSGATATGLSGDEETALSTASAVASAQLSDELNFGIDSGVFRVGINVSGSISLFSNNTIPDGNVDLSIGSTKSGVRTDYDVFERSAFYRSDLGFVTTSAIGDYGMNFVDIAFTGGSIDLDAILSTTARCAFSLVNVTVCTADVDFLSTAVFAGGSVLDSSGNTLSGVSLVSASGIDYLASVGVPSIIPVPASLPTLAVALGGLSMMARRKRKAR